MSESISTIVANINYKEGWKLLLNSEERDSLQWQFIAPDYQADNLPSITWKSRKWYLSKYMTESEIVQTAMAAALQAEEHEAREAFSYKNKHIFNPHISVEVLLELCTKLEVRA